MAEILCIRHGQASFGTDDYDQLSDLGYRQARVLGDYFVKSGERFKTIYAGTLKRQIQTAETVLDVYRDHGLAAPAIENDPRWNELDVEMQLEVLTPHLIRDRPELAEHAAKAAHDKKAFQKLIRATFDFWIEHPEITGEGSRLLEPWADVHQRITAALADAQAQNASGCRTAVFTSGGVIATIAAHAMQQAPRSVYPLFEKVINCSITRLIHNRNSLALSTFNEHSFLSAMAEQGEEQNIISYR